MASTSSTFRIFAALVIALSGCASESPQGTRSMETRAAPSSSAKAGASRDLPGVDKRESVRAFDGSVVFYRGEYHCAEGGHPDHKFYGDCDPIPVVVLLKPGGCIGLLPYKSLWIHSEKKRTKIVWQIFGPPQYEFSTTLDGIPISPVPGDTALPSDNYDGKQHQGRKFKWELKDTAKTPKEFYHLPNVVDTSTTPPTPCTPIDPGMINLVN